MSQLIAAIGVVKLLDPAASNQHHGTLLFKLDPENLLPHVAEDLLVDIGTIDVGVSGSSFWTIFSKEGKICLHERAQLGMSIGYIDPSGRIQIIHESGNDGTPAIDPPPQICTFDTTTILADGSSPFMTCTTAPAGIYNCSVWPTGPGCTDKTPVLAGKLISASPFSPTAAGSFNANFGKVELVSMRFQFPTALGPCNAIPLYRPSSPEFPLHAACVVAYPLANGCNKEIVLCCFNTQDKGLTQRIVNLRAIVREGENAITIASQSICFYPNPQSKTYYSSYADHTGYIPVEVDLLPLTHSFQKGLTMTSRKNQDTDADGPLRGCVVGEYCTQWIWQSCLGDPSDPQTTWRDFATVPVNVYLTLQSPGLPWKPTTGISSLADPTSAPFVGIVVLASRIAQGAIDEKSIVQLLAEFLINSGNFGYAASVGAFVTSVPVTSSVTDGNIRIEVLKMMQSVSGMMGKTIPVDCVDLSHTLMILANSIGCNLKVGLIQGETVDGGFISNKSIPLGSQIPVEGQQFTFHEVAYLGHDFDDSALVFDPCFCFLNKDGKYVPALGVLLKDYLYLLAATPQKLQTKPFSNSCIVELA